jgi:hypothetical protein
MFELLSMHNGANNGSIFLSVRDASDRLGFSSLHPASEAFKELLGLGLITKTMEGSFSIKAGEGSLARAWRLNWIHDDGKLAGPEKLAPIDFSKLSAKGKRRLAARQRALERYTKERVAGNLAVVDSSTPMARAVVECSTTPTLTVEESTTRTDRNGRNASSLDVVHSTTHILHHIPSAADAVSGHGIPQLSPSKKLGPSGILPAGKAA